MDVNRRLETIESADCFIDHVSENEDLSIDLHKNFPPLMKGYQITARRKKLRTLKQIAAYNVAKYILCKSDVKKLDVPHSLYKQVSIFLFCLQQYRNLRQGFQKCPNLSKISLPTIIYWEKDRIVKNPVTF